MLPLKALIITIDNLLKFFLLKYAFKYRIIKMMMIIFFFKILLPNNWRKTQLNFSFIHHFLDGGNNFPNFRHGVYPISQVICSRMKKQKVRFFSNTWLDIINNFFSCCTTICFDLNEIFLGNSGTCQMFNYITPNMISLLFVGTDLRFNSFLVVICSDLYVELVFFYFFGVYHLTSYYLWR